MARVSPEAVVRAVLYARVSTAEQAEEGESIDAQVRALREYVRRQGMVLVDEFLDEGVSATTDRRPAFQRMISAAKTKPRPFDLIIVHKSDRFARNREHAIVYKNLLRRECGVDVVSITEPFDDTPQGRLMEGILEVMAEFYSANLGQEVRKGMTEKARRGEVLGMAPVGYRNGEGGRLEPVPGAADAVRWIFETYAAGEMGFAAIARTLRQSGSTTFPGLPPLRWSAQAIRNVLRNEAYIGRRVWNMRGPRGRQRDPGEWIVVSEAHEAIVTPELFHRAKEQTAARVGPRGTLGDYLLRGLVRCEECGGSMYMRRMTPRGKPSGPATFILSCSHYARADGSCYFNWVPVDEVHDALLGSFKQILKDGVDPARFDFVFPDSGFQGERATIERALQQVHERFRRQLAAYEAGVLDLDDLREAKERVEAERATLEARLREVQVKERSADIPVSLIQQKVSTALEAIEGEDSDVSARRAILAQAVARVTYSRRQRRLRITLRV